MKIDYELVEKIGATHYAGKHLYKVVPMFDTVLMWDEDCYELCDFGPHTTANNFKPIPPKPPVRVEYEKVTDSIFDLKDDLERGELYTPTRGAGGDSYRKINDEQEFIMFATCGIFRRIEKPVDWRDEVVNYVESTNTDSGYFNVGYFNVGYECEEKFLTSEEFLEMCRVALRANGEL